MQIAPDPNALFIEAIADGLTIDHLEDPADQTRRVEHYARVKRLETLVQAHRRVLEQSPSSIDLDLDSIVVERGGTAIRSVLPTIPRGGDISKSWSRWARRVRTSVSGPRSHARSGGRAQAHFSAVGASRRGQARFLARPPAGPGSTRSRGGGSRSRDSRRPHGHLDRLLEGFTLEHLIKQNGPMSPERRH